jgi:FlaA1/EpsC-like NDP-sugar epimerase
LKNASGSASPVDWSNSSILVTGGTGSFGQRFFEQVLRKYNPRRLTVLSLDELKQGEMKAKYPEGFDSKVRFLLGDIRDYDRLRRAFRDVDAVLKTAGYPPGPLPNPEPEIVDMRSLI